MSKCAYEKSVSSKIPTKIFLDFCPEIFSSLLGGLPGSFFAFCSLPYLWHHLLSPQEAQKASRKPPGSYKKFQGRNPEIFLLLFWEKLIFHKVIIKLSDLYATEHIQNTVLYLGCRVFVVGSYFLKAFYSYILVGKWYHNFGLLSASECNTSHSFAQLSRLKVFSVLLLWRYQKICFVFSDRL